MSRRMVIWSQTSMSLIHAIGSPSKQGVRPARLVARDEKNDLALLKIEGAKVKAPPMRTYIRVGESVAAFGFPLSSFLATSGNFTLGNVTALAGLGDDSRYLQISAPIQPGNSGGPLLDERGMADGGRDA